MVIQMKDISLSTQDIMFIEYFKLNPFNSYKQFSIESNLSLQQIDSIRKRLQRYKILSCNKINGVDGQFCSEKRIQLLS